MKYPAISDSVLASHAKVISAAEPTDTKKTTQMAGVITVPSKID
jgi:hypothetical protein